MDIQFLYDKGSNCSQRVHWALRYKNVPYKSFLFTELSADQVQKISPLGKVPALVVDGIAFAESVAILEFLEENFPMRSLLPTEPIRRAKVREVVEIVNGWIHPIQCSSVPRFFIPGLEDEGVKDYRKRWLERTLPVLYGKLLFEESEFAIGRMFTWADLTLIPIYSKALILGVPLERFPRFQQHVRFCMNKEAIKNSCPEDLLCALEEYVVL